MLLVRRGAPEGSRFVDGDRARGLRRAGNRILGAARFRGVPRLRELRPVESGGRAGSARALAQVETAQFLDTLPPRALGRAGLLRPFVVYTEWPRAESGEQGDADQPLGSRAVPHLQDDPAADAERGSGLRKWIDQTSDREAARIDRIHGAVGVIPTPLWVVLLLISVVVFVFMLFFADRARARRRGGADGLGPTVVVSMLLLIGSSTARSTRFGGVRPVAMERTLRIIDEALKAVGEPWTCPATPRAPVP